VAANQFDMMEKGRSCKGSRQPAAKMTEAVVREARRRFREEGALIVELARDCGVTISTMGSAIAGKTWKHVL
jgi:hypothetical protein